MARTVEVENEKYVVFKRETFSVEPLPNQDAYRVAATAVEVKDAVVIRLQDVFAESALWTYANEIRAAIEILEVLQHDMDDPLVAKLDSIAEYFANMADAAGKATKKVPD